MLSGGKGLIIGLVILSVAVLAFFYFRGTPNKEPETKSQLEIVSPVNSSNKNNADLTITSPVDGMVSISSQIVVSGKTKSKSRVLIDGQSKMTEDDGEFKMIQNLSKGRNIVKIEVLMDGKTIKRELAVNYQPVK